MFQNNLIIYIKSHKNQKTAFTIYPDCNPLLSKNFQCYFLCPYQMPFWKIAIFKFFYLCVSSIIQTWFDHEPKLSKMRMMLYLYKIETYFCNQDQTNVNLNKLLFQSAGSALEAKKYLFSNIYLRTNNYTTWLHSEQTDLKSCYITHALSVNMALELQYIM